VIFFVRKIYISSRPSFSADSALNMQSQYRCGKSRLLPTTLIEPHSGRVIIERATQALPHIGKESE